MNSVEERDVGTTPNSVAILEVHLMGLDQQLLERVVPGPT